MKFPSAEKANVTGQDLYVLAYRGPQELLKPGIQSCSDADPFADYLSMSTRRNLFPIFVNQVKSREN